MDNVSAAPETSSLSVESHARPDSKETAGGGAGETILIN